MYRIIKRKSTEKQSDSDAERSLMLRVSKMNLVSSNCTSTTIHFDECLKLFMENKINKKDVWHLNLIDIMFSMLREKHPTMGNLIIASLAIGASTRIYSLRVDALYSDVLNMADGLPKLVQAKRPCIMSDECESPNCQDTEAGPSKRRRRTSKVGVVSDPKELNRTTDSMDINIGNIERRISTTASIKEKTSGLMSRGLYEAISTKSYLRPKRKRPKQDWWYTRNKRPITLEDNEDQNNKSDTSFCSNNILDAKNSIPYELRQKKIDMKELNNCTWNLLTENTQEGEDFPPNTLRNVYSKLPSQLSNNMRESLSFPLVFLSALHLATEKGLTLVQKDNLEDIGILGKNKNDFV